MSATQRPQRKNTGFSTALQAMLKTQPMHADSNVASAPKLIVPGPGSFKRIAFSALPMAGSRKG